MKLVLFGATGRTGGEILDVCLSRGHDVTAVVRSNSARLAPGARIVRADFSDAAALAQIVDGHDAVLSAIGPQARDALRAGCSVMHDTAAVVVAAMKACGVSRLGVVSAAVLFDEPGLRYAFFRWFLRHHAVDLAAMESLLFASGLDVTVARPPRLIARRDEGYVAAGGALPPGPLSMSFRAVAAFLVDAIERHTYSGERVGLRAAPSAMSSSLSSPSPSRAVP